jgi:hypothetical protein
MEAERALPLIRNCIYGGLEHVLQPSHFGWIIFVAGVCEYIGFPKHLSGYRDTAWRLDCETRRNAFEARNEAHTILVREMYERFSGGRSMFEGRSPNLEASSDTASRRESKRMMNG